MDQRTLLMQFWAKEAPSMRQVISRIPEDSTYRPHPRSRTAREIAWLIVREEIALVEGLEKGRFEWSEAAAPAPPSINEIVEAYDKLHATANERLAAAEAENWEKPLPFFLDGKEVMQASGADMAWGFLFDLIHHRGQLTTYLRPMGAKVPQVYGPTADEP